MEDFKRGVFYGTFAEDLALMDVSVPQGVDNRETYLQGVEMGAKEKMRRDYIEEGPNV